MEYTIPNKSLFKQDEVCKITGVKPYVLRFWESEFDQIKTVLNSNGKKLYEQEDVKKILIIKKLLFEDKLTIEKAKFTLLSYDFDNLKEDCDDACSQDIPLCKEDVELEGQVKDSWVAAKVKLDQMLKLTESIQKSNNW